MGYPYQSSSGVLHMGLLKVQQGSTSIQDSF